MNKLLTFTFAFLHFAVVAQKAKSDLNTHSNESFSISYPIDWELKTDGATGVQFYVLSPLTSKEDLFRENVNVLTQDLKGQGIDLAQYASISEGQIPEMIPEGKIFESETKKSKAGTYHRIGFSGIQNDVLLTFLQYYFVKDEKAYVLTLTCEAGEYETYKGQGEKILASFRFKQ